MVLTFTAPARYPWVLLTAISVGWLATWQVTIVAKHRKASQIKYPQLYAEQSEVKASDAALKFNCAQRAHQNTLETLPQFLFYLLFTGLYYPEVATGTGVVWILGRVIYTLGYITGDPQKRTTGSFQFVVSLGIHLLATWTAGKLVLSSL